MKIYLLFFVAAFTAKCSDVSSTHAKLKEDNQKNNLSLDRTNQYSRGKDDFPKEKQFQTAVIDLGLKVRKVSDSEYEALVEYRAEVFSFTPEIMIPKPTAAQGKNEYSYGFREVENSLNVSAVSEKKESPLLVTSNSKEGSYLTLSYSLGKISKEMLQEQNKFSGKIEVANIRGVLIEAEDSGDGKEVLGSKDANQIIRWEISNSGPEKFDGKIDLEQIDGRGRGLKSEDLLRLLKSNYQDAKLCKEPFPSERPKVELPPPPSSANKR